MAMKGCPDCGRDVSSKANACPHCGRRLRRRPSCTFGCASIILTLFLALTITTALRSPGPHVAAPGAGDAPPRPAATPWQATPTPEPCQEHIELHSAARWAREMGQTEAWVVANHRINLFARPVDQGRGGKVGELLPGSRASIVKRGENEYQIRSPLDGSVGWVSALQVARTLHQDVNTREPCEP